MRKPFTLIALLCCCIVAANAQDTTGLIAHWNMNGTSNDVSGHGNNGTGYYLTPAAGEDGVMGDAWYFNGSTSYIWVPYSPMFNLQKYTICAKVKVMGFYSGPCEANMIMGRGKTGTGTGTYSLFIAETNGDECITLDTMADNFITIAADFPNAGVTAYNHTPNTVENVWYNVVATLNDSVYKIYINDTLTVSTPVTTLGGTMGTTTDGINIGLNTFEAAYPYPFKGVIDDILLYNRALTDSEVVHVYDTCGAITLQPANKSISSAGGTVTYTVSSSISSATYQWQQNSGTGFVNLSNAGQYSGVTTPTLTITGTTSAMDYYLYRCIVANEVGCVDTSAAAYLKLGVTNIANNETITVFPNPAHTALSIWSSRAVEQVVISDLLGQAVLTLQPNTQKVQVDISALPSGLYFVRVNNMEVRKFVKE